MNSEIKDEKKPGSVQGSWYKPETGESLYPDLDEGKPIRPHWDYRNEKKEESRLYLDGTWEWKTMEEVKRTIKKYALDPEKTLPYFVNHIRCGKILSERVCGKIDFSKGSFSTILPEDAVVDKLYAFDWGGKIPSIPYGTETHIIKGSSKSFHPREVITMDRECSQLIANFLARSDGNWTVVENYMLDPQSRFIHEENVKMSPYNADVYYFLNGSNSVDEIGGTLRKSKEMWHSLAILTELKAVPDILTDTILDKICENTRFVITGAYDGEGYIIWQRK